MVTSSPARRERKSQQLENEDAKEDGHGAIILWSFFSIQLSWVALTCWRRTGLPFATAGMACGAVMSMSLVVLAVMGQPFPDLAPESWVLFGASALLAPLFLLIESRVNHAKWQEWSRYMEHKNVWDIITGRHIPQIRDRAV
ncbi:MAG: hypothetical protein WD690_09935 [Vicinamibacterales bacterium]